MSRTLDYPGLRILNIFFQDPYREVHLRQAAAQAQVSPSTAKRFLDEYTRLGLLNETQKANLHLFRANLDKASFRLWKTSLFLLKNEPYLRRLADQYPDSSLTLYGSCSTGTDGPESDLDLLLITRKRDDPSPKQLDEISRRTHRTAQLLKYTPEEWEKKAREDKPFYERVIIDGIAISGPLPVVVA
jgi:predicted nucleotidyltransferase